MEEARPELLVDHPPVEAGVARRPAGHVRPHRLGAARARQVVPAGRRPVGGQRVELHEVDVQPALHRQLSEVEGIGRERAERVEQGQLDEVAVVGAREERHGRLVEAVLDDHLRMRLRDRARAVDLPHLHPQQPVVVTRRVVPALPVVLGVGGEHLDVVVDHPVRGRQPDLLVRAAAQPVQVDEQDPGLWVGHHRRVEGVALGRGVQAHLQQPAPAAHVRVEQRGRGRRLLRVHAVDEPRESRLARLHRLRHAPGQLHQREAGRAVRVGPGAVHAAVEAAPQPPHAVVEVGVEVAVPDDVADRVLAAAGAVERVDVEAGLRADGDRVEQLRALVLQRAVAVEPPHRGLGGVLRHGPPLVHVQVEDVGLLDPAVHQPDPRRVALVRAQHRGLRLAEQPRAVVLLLARHPLDERAVRAAADEELLVELVAETARDGGAVDPALAGRRVRRRALGEAAHPVRQPVGHRLGPVRQRHDAVLAARCAGRSRSRARRA